MEFTPIHFVPATLIVLIILYVFHSLSMIVLDHLFEEYVSSLPENIRPFLDKTLDWDHQGDLDLNHIAQQMIDWEEKLSALFGLTHPNIVDLKKGETNSPTILR